MQLKSFSDEETFVKESLQIIESAYKKGGRYFACAGSMTAVPVYQAFVNSNIVNVREIHVYLVDERYVPANNPDSNYAKLKKAMGEKFEYMDVRTFNTELSIIDALDDYEKQLNAVLDKKFDLAILGIGTDGHVGSLFPQSNGLYESERMVAHTTTETLAIRDRLTMTFPMIMRSKQILVLLAGAQKKMILEEVLESDKTIAELPAKALLNHENVIVHFFDN